VTSPNRLYFVENLTLRAWLWSILPRFILGALRRRGIPAQCYVISGSRLAMLMARISAAPAGVAVRRLIYRVRDVHDDKGQLVQMRIEFGDLLEAQYYAVAERAFQKLIQSGQLKDRQALFLAKAIGHQNVGDPNAFWQTLFLVQLCLWKAEQEGYPTSAPVMFISSRAWFNSLRLYASKHGIETIKTFAPLNLYGVLHRKLPQPLMDLARAIRLGLSQGNLLQSFKKHIGWMFSSAMVDRADSSHSETQDATESSHPKVVIGYSGQLNLNEPHLHSDLFFWQQSPLEGTDLLMAFSWSRDPFDEEKQDQLAEHGIHALVLDYRAATVSGVPFFKANKSLNKKLRAPAALRRGGLEGAWLKRKLANYAEMRSYWTEMLDSCNGKVFVTHQNTDSSHIAIADALDSVGGILAMYQRSYEPHPSSLTATYSDIAFRFSDATAPLEEISNSVIKYHVATGYLGDHRFSLLRARSGAVRAQLERNGARQIIAYFDENSGDNDRTHTGHSFMQENYAFIFEKVLAEPWLGLILKPKNPGSLRRRLGPVAQQMEEAQATGRCYVFEGGPIQSPHCPAAAAMEADLAIHGHLASGTAGVEATLAGVPTLILDREGWPVSPLYRLPMGKVVFTNWPDLWKSCLEHWATQGGTPGFGDWSLLLDDLDPFRDGLASARMGNYLQWLMEGFKAGLNRDTVMADAAERYAEQWGADKVNQVNGGWRPGQMYASDPRSMELIDLSKEPLGEQELEQGRLA
jgi:hypothetical protein